MANTTIETKTLIVLLNALVKQGVTYVEPLEGVTDVDVEHLLENAKRALVREELEKTMRDAAYRMAKAIGQPVVLAYDTHGSFLIGEEQEVITKTYCDGVIELFNPRG